ncbi:DNA primase family protein [Mycobacterium colombiense]|uniref:DNA primase family protein n=1 Tax=Mycobacterium colombiense TaxID=339268 RepID=UPI00200B1E6D|nr:phage/plasmid primase, P4 family [Mycobacterium colombiense]MCK8645636.1 phage/plasmid primase, P4 family [Mycobacterium colombiense]
MTSVSDDGQQPAKGGIGTGLHDAYNARVFRANCAGRFRYVPERRRWIEWNGPVWQELCDTGPVEEAAEQVIRDYVISGDKAGEAHSRRSLSERGIRAAIRLASNYAEMRISSDLLDSHPSELNTPSGIIDLISGKLIPPQADHWHTKMTGVPYDPNAPCAQWKTFLDTTFDKDDELISYMQRLIGYAATGQVTEHILPFLHGAGQNGKTVLLETVSKVLGDYAMSAPANFLLVGRNEHPTELARLQGARLVVCSEINEGCRFDEQKVKQLTGGDRIAARLMHRDYIEFRPSHTIFLMGNHHPTVRAGGDAFWRRLQLIPFEHRVPDAARVKGLDELLVSTEGPAILAWIVAGAVDVAANGLQPPSKVVAATQEYADSEDTIGQFIVECIRPVHPDTKIASSLVYRRYTQWCSENGIPPKDRSVFGRELSSRGHRVRQSHGKRYVFGVTLDRLPIDHGWMPE